MHGKYVVQASCIRCHQRASIRKFIQTEQWSRRQNESGASGGKKERRELKFVYKYNSIISYFVWIPILSGSGGRGECVGYIVWLERLLVNLLRFHRATRYLQIPHSFIHNPNRTQHKWEEDYYYYYIAFLMARMKSMRASQDELKLLIWCWWIWQFKNKFISLMICPLRMSTKSRTLKHESTDTQ